MNLSLRPILGPSFALLRSIPAVPPDPDKPPKLDVEVELIDTDEDAWTITLGVAPYDLKTHNLLSEVRAYLTPQGHGLPASAADYVASSSPFTSINLRQNVTGVTVVLPLSEVDPANYFGQIVLLFDDNATDRPASD